MDSLTNKYTPRRHSVSLPLSLESLLLLFVDGIHLLALDLFVSFIRSPAHDLLGVPSVLSGSGVVWGLGLVFLRTLATCVCVTNSFT